jgi:hypothetical protein
MQIQLSGKKSGQAVDSPISPVMSKTITRSNASMKPGDAFLRQGASTQPGELKGQIAVL